MSVFQNHQKISLYHITVSNRRGSGYFAIKKYLKIFHSWLSYLFQLSVWNVDLVRGTADRWTP